MAHYLNVAPNHRQQRVWLGVNGVPLQLGDSITFRILESSTPILQTESLAISNL